MPQPSGHARSVVPGLIAMGVLLLASFLPSRIAAPVGEFEPSADPSVDAYAVVDAEAGTYRAPVDTIIEARLPDHSMLAPIAPAGGFVEVDTSTRGIGPGALQRAHLQRLPQHQRPRMVGPTMQGIFGRAGKFADGSAYTADEAYLTGRSAPMAVVEGYPPRWCSPSAERRRDGEPCRYSRRSSVVVHSNQQAASEAACCFVAS